MSVNWTFGKPFYTICMDLRVILRLDCLPSILNWKDFEKMIEDLTSPPYFPSYIPLLLTPFQVGCNCHYFWWPNNSDHIEHWEKDTSYRLWLFVFKPCLTQYVLIVWLKFCHWFFILDKVPFISHNAETLMEWCFQIRCLIWGLHLSTVTTGSLAVPHACNVCCFYILVL